MNTTPTQVQHPWRTTLRTVVWLVVGVVVSIPTIWPIIVEETSRNGLTISPAVQGAVAWAVALIVTVTAIVQRVVLIPGVAAVIEKVPGLAPQPAADPVPQRAVTPAPVAPSVTANADGTITVDPGTAAPGK